MQDYVFLIKNKNPNHNNPHARSTTNQNDVTFRKKNCLLSRLCVNKSIIIYIVNNIVTFTHIRIYSMVNWIK